MPKLIGAVLARNEADRYLARVLANMAQFCDETVVLDDHSTDDTRRVVEQAGAEWQLAPGGPDGWWGTDETTPRAALWAAAARKAGRDGWILVLDADMELIEVTHDEIRALTTSDHCTAWAWPLLDCWDSDETHRVDGWWQAWRMPRAWMFRVQPSVAYRPDWGHGRGIHAGHCPPNYPVVAGVAPGWIRHLSYVRPEDRAAKLERYMALA